MSEQLIIDAEAEAEEYWFSAEVATFGDRLAAAREFAKLDQEEFSRRLGVAVETVLEWEDDLREPRANRLSMMAGLLNVSVGWLLTGEGEGVASPEGEAGDSGSHDVAGLLIEIRDSRAQLKSALDQLGRLEKKLRKLGENNAHG